MTDKAQNTDVKCDDLPVIAPRDDGFCPSTAACPQFYRFHKAHLCKIEGNDYDMEGHICPIWATRTAARLEAVDASLKWLVHLHHGLSKGGEEFEPPSDQEWTDCLDEAKELLSTYPGKDGQ